MKNFTVQVCNLSPKTTKKDVKDFFSFSGTVENVRLERAGEWAQVAFVTFKEPHALETAVLLSGATIVDRQVCIVPWGGSEEAVNLWKNRCSKLDEEHTQLTGSFVPSSARAITMAQDVVTTMGSKGYILGKDALSKAKDLDEKYQVTANAAAKVAAWSEKMGITDKINAGTSTVRSVDERYGILEKSKVVGDKSKSVLVAAGQTMTSAGTAVVNSSYFSSGALWVSGALSKAAKSAADLGGRGNAMKN